MTHKYILTNRSIEQCIIIKRKWLKEYANKCHIVLLYVVESMWSSGLAHEFQPWPEKNKKKTKRKFTDLTTFDISDKFDLKFNVCHKVPSLYCKPAVTKIIKAYIMFLLLNQCINNEYILLIELLKLPFLIRKKCPLGL